MLNIDDRFLNEVNRDQFWFMCHIARFMGKDSTCFPSNKVLCESTGWGESKLNDVKRSCIDSGLLKVEPRFLENKQRSNVYKIVTDRISIVVNLKGKEIPTADAVPYRTDGTTPTAYAVPEVLTIVTSSSYAQSFENDFRVKEAFTMSRKIPPAKYESYLKAWISEITATGEQYAKHSEAVKHFLNYSATKHRIEVQEKEKVSRAAAPHQAPAVGMRKGVPVYGVNGLEQ